MIGAAKKKRADAYAVRLCEACAKGELEKVARLLRVSSLDVNRGDYDMRRGIHLAACEGHVEVLELLIAAGADVNVQDRYGGTPLADALRHKQRRAGSFLHANGARLLFTDAAERLCTAAADADGHDMLEMLLEYNSDVNAADYDSRTPLMLAAAEGHTEHVRLLLQRNADVNLRDRWGATALCGAFVGGFRDCSRQLLDHGGDLGGFDKAGHLCTAAAEGNVEVLQRLLEHRCSVNESTYTGRTALHLAAANACITACHLLLRAESVDVNIEDAMGNTPLDDARREAVVDQAVVVALLETRGCRPGSHAPKSLGGQFGLTRGPGDQGIHVRLSHQRTMLAHLQEMDAWIRHQGSLGRKLKAQVEAAVRLESERGEVIPDAQPNFFKELQTFAASHPERCRYASDVMQNNLLEWSERMDDFAFGSRHDMEQNFKRLKVGPHPGGERPRRRWGSHGADACPRHPLGFQVGETVRLQVTVFNFLRDLAEANVDKGVDASTSRKRGGRVLRAPASVALESPASGRRDPAEAFAAPTSNSTSFRTMDSAGDLLTGAASKLSRGTSREEDDMF